VGIVGSRDRSMRYFEDFKVGDVIPLAPLSIGEAEILAFARKFDPQPMHLDPEAARRGAFGGLIASGWHTCALAMRATAAWFAEAKVAALGSPGLDQVRWLAPVRPGDRLAGSFEVLEMRPSSSRPMGIVKQRLEFRNQAGTLVLSMIGTGFFARRPEPAA